MASGKKTSSASIRQRLLNLARDQGRVFEVVLVNYGLERLMYRLSISEHRDSFVLKGGMLVTLWIEDGNRVTRDADFLGFCDASDERLITVFSEILSNSRELLEPGELCLFRVVAEDRDGEVRLTGEGVRRLDAAAAAACSQLRVDVDAPEALEAVRRRLGAVRPPGPREAGEVVISLRLGARGGGAGAPASQRVVEIRLPEKAAVTPAARSALKSIDGVVGVELV